MKGHSIYFVNPIALKKAKIVYNFGLSESNMGYITIIWCYGDFIKESLKRADIVFPYKTSADLSTTGLLN